MSRARAFALLAAGIAGFWIVAALFLYVLVHPDHALHEALRSVVLVVAVLTGGVLGGAWVLAPLYGGRR